MDVKINPAFVLQPVELEVFLMGPTPGTRLFIYTGIAILPPQFQDPTSDNVKRATARLSLSDLHNRTFESTATKHNAPIASLASIRTHEDANDFTWAVETARTEVEPQGTTAKLALVVDLISQGKLFSAGTFASALFVPFHRIAYQVNVVTEAPTSTLMSASIRLLKVRSTRLSAGKTTLANVTLAKPVASKGLTLSLTSDRPDLLKIPARVKISTGKKSASFEIRARHFKNLTRNVKVSVIAFAPGKKKLIKLTVLAR